MSEGKTTGIEGIAAVLAHAANHYTPTGAVSFGGSRAYPDVTADDLELLTRTADNVIARINAVIDTIPNFDQPELHT